MRSRKPMFGRTMTLLALQKPGAANYFSILRPNTGESFFDMEVCLFTALAEAVGQRCVWAVLQSDWSGSVSMTVTANVTM